jgi:hypothetical protein
VDGLVSTEPGGTLPNPVEDDGPSLAPLTLTQLKTMHPPVKGTRAVIPATLWDRYLWAAAEVSFRQAELDMAEAEIRELARDAAALVVDGAVVANRIVSKLENISWVRDFYRRVPTRKGNAGAQGD